jgi:hypothetical protein
MRPLISSLRSALVAMLAIAIVAARPAMMASHDMPGMANDCGMAMRSHGPTHADHGCPSTTQDECCNDCVCACAIGSDVKMPLVVLVATYMHVTPAVVQPVRIVPSSREPALLLPPPLGPPLSTRS